MKGEGEGPLLELLAALRAGRPVDDIPNLSYWSGGRCGRGRKVPASGPGLLYDLVADVVVAQLAPLDEARHALWVAVRDIERSSAGDR